MSNGYRCYSGNNQNPANSMMLVAHLVIFEKCTQHQAAAIHFSNSLNFEHSDDVCR